MLSSCQGLLKRAQKKLIPLHCLFELTYHCNLKCRHCYIVQDAKKEVALDKVFAILRQLKACGCLYLTLSGGEIFLRKDFFEIAQYARKLNFALRLFTNGTLIDEDVADKISLLYPIAVEISLYGLKDTHERITRVKGSFQKTIQAIKLLRERKIKVLVKATLMKQNVFEFWKLKAYIEGLGASMRGVGGSTLISPCDNGNFRPLNYRLSDRQLRGYLSAEQQELKKMGWFYHLEKIKKGEKLCGAGLATCNITPFAEVNPCVQIRIRQENNLKERTFQDIWQHHPEFIRLRRLTKESRVGCRDCRFSTHCFFCPGTALLEKGSLLTKLPEACRQARLRKEVYEGIFTGQKRVALRKETG
jgi:radical SAM protein with 4Fe4S-binding SPASM domain